MSSHSDVIVRRVVDAMDPSVRGESVVHDHFDRDRRAVIDAAMETLEATGESVPRQQIEQAVDREMIEALRLPDTVDQGLLPWMYIRRGRIGAALALVAAALVLFI